MKKTNLILILCLFNLIHAARYQEYFISDLSSYGPVIPTSDKLPYLDKPESSTYPTWLTEGSIFDKKRLEKEKKIFQLKNPGSSTFSTQLTADKYTQNCANNWNVCFWGKGQHNNIEECDKIYKDQNGNFLNTCFYNTSWS